MQLDQIGLMLLEAGVASCLLLLLFHRRRSWGLSPLYLGLGVFQHLQVVLATTIYVEVWPEVYLSPGSVVLFTASMFAILLVYIDAGATETRALIYGLVIANAVLATLSYLVSLHLLSDSTLNLFNLPRAYFVQDLRVLIAGTIVVFLDAILLIVVYETLGKRLLRWTFLRIYFSISLVLVVDQVFFATAAFAPSPQYYDILTNGLIGKAVSALFYSFVLWLYTRFLSVPDSSAESRLPFDVFSLLSYRQKYDLLGQEYDLLEERVLERTRELSHVNDLLQLEVEERSKTEITLREREGKLEQLSRRLMDVHESERRSLAKELHDQIGQALTFIRLKLSQPVPKGSRAEQGEADPLLKIVDETIQQVRELSHQLRPAVLDDLGLIAALEWQAKLISKRTDLSVEFIPEIDDAQLPTEVRTACFRIAQEALTNAMRHAQATSVKIALTQANGKILLTVQDDGVGLEVTEIRKNNSNNEGFGLSGMQERAELIGGDIKITSNLGASTQVQLVFPISGTAKSEPGGEPR